MEGLLNFYAATHITLQTFPQECFLMRFVCFIIIIACKNRRAASSSQKITHKFHVVQF